MKDIPRDQPLSDFDRQYLMDRNRFDIIQAIDEAYPPSTDVADPPAPATIPDRSAPGQPDDAQNAPQQPTADPAGSTAQQQPSAEDDDDDDEDDDTDDSGGETSDNYDNEEAWSIDDLRTELRQRELPDNGRRKTLVRRLRKDDKEDRTD